MIYVIYLRNGSIVLSKKNYSSWREIQDEYTDYMTSLGPWVLEDILNFFEQEYGNEDRDWAFTRKQIEAFSESKDVVLKHD